ncbi:MAG TPA: TVP38/TMEM64 family protein [Acidobacteriota bacterium]|nr:TVP38/TMEM64 family protein [Acidobacteriota bacterium]
MDRSRTAWLRWSLVVFLLLTAILALVFLPVRQYVQVLLSETQALGLWGGLVLIAVYVVAAVFFLPGSLITLAAGFLFGVLVGSVVVSIGATLGAAAAFLTGRYLARDRVERKLASYSKFRAIDQAVGREGFKIVMLTRLTPVFPYNLLNYAFGLTSVSFRHYILASWIGMMPGTVLYVYLGSTARDLTQVFSGQLEGGVAQQAPKILGLVATVLVTIVVTRIARRSLQEAVSESSTEGKLV